MFSSGLVLPSVASAQLEERLGKMLEKYPQADADGDGKLSVEEARAFKAKSRDKSPQDGEDQAGGERAPKSPMKRVSREALAEAYAAREFEGGQYRCIGPAKELEDGEKVPLILSLHGAGGKGKENMKNLMAWNGVMLDPAFQEKYPCYVVSPQSPAPWRTGKLLKKLTPEELETLPEHYKNERMSTRLKDAFERADAEPQVLDVVYKLLDELAEEYPIDTDRVYVLGHSMGGFGTWTALASAPDRFAAGIPSAGGLGPWIGLEPIKHVPIWCFHGDLDKTVVPEHSRYLFAEMKQLGGNMKYTELGGVAHGSNAFAFCYTGDSMHEGFKTEYSSDQCDRTEDVWEWLFKQKLER